MNRVIAIIGPSGSGKTSLSRALQKTGLRELVSFTTRRPREGELDGRDYHFVTPEEIKKQDLVEKTEYAGNAYGLTKNEVRHKLALGDVLFVCDKSGCEMLAQAFPEQVHPVWLKAHPELLLQRMRERGDSAGAIWRRLAFAKKTGEFSPPAFSHLALEADMPLEEQVEVVQQEILKEERKAHA